MTVLITGGWGFIGRHLARALTERGDDVVLFDAAAPDREEVTRLAGERASLVSGDIRQPGAVLAAMRDSGADSVIHAAAVVGVSATAHDPRQAADVARAGRARWSTAATSASTSPTSPTPCAAS